MPEASRGDRTRGTEEAISVSCCRVSPASARVLQV
ncbi:hypothetical protein MANES_17G084755v8 [Manihot esculenta]|uniref:Uncharacterized protein n=1 Tax=Manihot esculenta TaxID=3983 RepID=A0ACB7G7T4_MANES|nr:hypothetical protein MANES_17G084755v8 [Manihot esculenta]